MRAAHGTGSHTAETSFYPAIANLFNSVGEKLKPRVVFVAHPSTGHAGLPDGGFYPIANRRQSEPLPNQLPERGAVEIKAPGESLATLATSAQVRSYLQSYGLCLITNYHQFQLLELVHNQPRVLESYDLAPTAAGLWNLPNLAANHHQTLPDFLARVMTRKVPLEKPKDVAWLLASYAREARARAATHPLAAFDGVKSALQESLGITFEGDKGANFFLSTLIQTLFYGIFSAWILWRRTPEGRVPAAIFNWRLSAEYLRIPVLRQLFHAIAEPGALHTVQITEVLDHANDALNRVHPGFFDTFNEEDAVNYFYEPFLEAFDPELRKQLGVWYTPREIVRYMVERVDHLLRTELNEPLGLASTNVQILDPCCGTGAYLVEVLHRIERTLRERAGDDDALIGSDLRTAATTRVFGFEIMPAPFVIAHLQVAYLLEKAGSSLTANQRAQVFLTNALTGWVPARHPQSNFGFPAFTEERDAAEAVKQADTILVILGNPPYNGYAGIAQIEEERDLTTAYRTPIGGLPAPQGQGLNDLYVRFFRIAERRIVGDKQAKGNKNGRGLVSFISNNAWLDGLSQVSMRAKLLQEFQSIYVDNLNGDSRRTGKTTPDGTPDPSAFSTPQNREGIQVGTAISTFVRTGSATSLSSQSESSLLADVAGKSAATAANPVTENIHLRNFWGTQKLAELEREARREAGAVYKRVSPVPALGLTFDARSHSRAYAGWPRLTELFAVSSPGIKTSRDALLVDLDRNHLERRMRAYLDPDVPNNAVLRSTPGALNDTPRFASAETRAKLQKRGYRDWQILRFAYRPFDIRWLYWEPTTKLLDEKREDYVSCLNTPSYTLVAQQKPRSRSDPPQCVSVLACIDIMDRSASCFPIQTVGEANFNWLDGKLDRSSGPISLICPNLTIPAESYLDQFGIWELASVNSTKFAAASAELFFHALATMHTPQYRTENSGALLGDWPRIPLPATAELLTHSATLGRRLAELLDPESDIQLVAEWSFLARLILPAELPEGASDRDQRNANRLALTAGWGGAGQGATVMPRRGDARERDWTPTELERLTTLATAESLTLDDALTLLGTRCVDIYLNGDALWSAVPLNVWDYTLGGYQVLKKWLSYRELPLLGRPLREDEARYFAQVARRIAAILLMGPALDASYAAILPTATGLPATMPNM